jgi:hypothetical protein
MKNPVKMLKEIKTLLGVELSEKVKLAQMTLENGTVLESESFEPGSEVFIVTDDEKVSLPVGEYELEDGKVLKITEDGIIDSIGDAPAESEDAPAEESLAEDDEKKDEKEEEEMGYATKKELEEVKEVVEEIKKMLEPIVEDVVEEVVEGEADLKAELSKPASAPIKHNPEAKPEQRKNLYSQKRTHNTLDRVMQKISNFK